MHDRGTSTLRGLGLTRKSLRAMPYVDAGHVGWRRLAACVLLTGVRANDREFLTGRWSRVLADALDLPQWPPRLGES